MVYLTGGNGTSTGNDTEDEDHEFFDAMEEGISTTLENKSSSTSFVIKVPVSSSLPIVPSVNYSAYLLPTL